MTEQTRKDRPSSIVFVLSLVLLLLFWSALALWKADPMVLPGPGEVLRVGWEEVRSGRLPRELAATLARVVIAFALAMAAGSVLGYALGRWRVLDRWFDPWVTVFLNLPALVLIVLCYLWIGLNEVAAITAVTLNKTAMVLVMVRQGVRSFDAALEDLAAVSRLSPGKRLRHIVLPQLAPWLAASARNGISVIWKVILVVEFLGRSNGVGFRIHLYFQQFQTAHVLAYSLAFVIVMLCVEHGLLQPWERWSNRWRRN